MRATLGGLLLLKLVASRLTSCVNGPGWTPWADKPAKPARASSRKSQASANAPLDKFYIYDERDGPEFSLARIRALGQAARKSGTETWRHFVDAVGSSMQHQAVTFLLDAILDHPARTTNPAEAKWLVVPIGINPKTPAYLLGPTEHNSWIYKGRNGSRLDMASRIHHREALARLTKSATWKARAADHVFLSGSWCGWTKCPGVEAHGIHRVLRAGGYVGTLDRHFYALQHVGLAAWRERAPHADAQALYDASTILLPYVSAPEFSKKATAQPHRSFVFQGREDRRGPGGAGRRRLPELAQHLPGSRICFSRGSIGSLGDHYTAAEVAATAAATRTAEYCFAPAGDTPTSSRLYSSLATGCVPVVLADRADQDVFPFAASIDWGKIAVVAPTLTNETDLTRLAASLRADRPRREVRRAAGAAAFASHLDYIGNARGVVDAFLRELSVARGRRAALEARPVVSRAPARKRPGLRVDGGDGGGACPTVALLTGHPRSGTTAAEELLFLREGAHVVDEPLAQFQNRAPKWPNSVDHARGKLTLSARAKGYATLGGALACDRAALRTLLEHNHGSRQFTHTIRGDLIPAAQACGDKPYRRRRACLDGLVGRVVDRWSQECAATTVRASKLIRLNGQLGVELLLRNNITWALGTALGCAPRIAVIMIVRHPADVLLSNYETTGLQGLRGTIRMPPLRGIKEKLYGAEGEAMCLETLQDLAAGAALRQSGRIPRTLDVAETNDAWRLIRYPDLVRDPAAVTSEIHTWLGLPPAPPGRPVARASTKAYSTERRSKYAFGHACEAIAPTPWNEEPPSCTLVIQDLKLERVCKCSAPHFIDRWRPANDNATLTVYVPIDKSGSTTVRGALLRSRAWGLCLLGRPGTRAQGDPVCRGDAIAIGSYGDCRAVAPRKCQYFTVLRDPVARRVSEYDWFCRACKEGNKYCGRLVMACPPPGDPAPPPTLEAWAQRSPNVYTQIFSREEACGGYAALAAGSTRLDADAYARAAAALAAPDMLVLTTEDLDNSWGRLDTYLGRQPGEGIAKPTARANVYSGDRYRAPPEERERVAALEHYDVALYDAIARGASGSGMRRHLTAMSTTAATAAAPKCILRVPLVILKGARAGSKKLARDLRAVTGCPTRHEIIHSWRGPQAEDACAKQTELWRSYLSRPSIVTHNPVTNRGSCFNDMNSPGAENLQSIFAEHPDAVVVSLTRRNALRHAISLQCAMQTKDWLGSSRACAPWNATGWPPRRVAAATANSYRQRKRIVAVATRVGATLHVDYENFAADPRGTLSQILGLVAAPEAVSAALAGIAPPRPETEVDASAAFAEPGRVKEALEAACLGWTWHGGSFTGSRDPQPPCGRLPNL